MERACVCQEWEESAVAIIAKKPFGEATCSDANVGTRAAEPNR